jgi:hypothetical protein
MKWLFLTLVVVTAVLAVDTARRVRNIAENAVK